MSVWEDEVAIRGLVELFLSAIDSKDFEKLRPHVSDDFEIVAFADPDGTGGNAHRGIDAPSAAVAGIAASCHAAANSVVVVDGDTASSDTFAVAFVEVGEAHYGRILIRGIRYRDEFVRLADGWRMKRRVHSALWQFDAAAMTPAMPTPTEQVWKDPSSPSRS